MKKVILTGANGFIGSSVATLLIERGFEVHTLGRTPASAMPASIIHHQMDLLKCGNASTISEIGADTLIHVAWCTQPGTYWSTPENLLWVSASLQLLNAFVTGGGKRVVIAGTCAEYDWRYHTLVEDETPLLPSTLYGQAKASLNTLTSSFAKHHGFSLAWAHIFFPYGPNEKRGKLTSDLICNLLAGVETSVSEGRQIRDFLHVEDTAAALVQIAESDIRGAINIGCGEGKTLRELIETAARLVGKPELVKYGARPPIKNDPPCLLPSVSRLQNEVGFFPRYTLESGLQSSIDWWKTQQR